MTTPDTAAAEKTAREMDTGEPMTVPEMMQESDHEDTCRQFRRRLIEMQNISRAYLALKEQLTAANERADTITQSYNRVVGERNEAIAETIAMFHKCINSGCLTSILEVTPLTEAFMAEHRRLVEGQRTWQPMSAITGPHAEINMIARAAYDMNFAIITDWESPDKSALVYGHGDYQMFCVIEPPSNEAIDAIRTGVRP